MDVEAGMLLEPCADRRALVSPVVVTDQVHIELTGDQTVDLGQELLELDRAVAAMQT